MNKSLQKYTDFLFYTMPNGIVSVQIILGQETVWASQENMSLIFDTTRQNVGKHLTNSFESGELLETDVGRSSIHTAPNGKEYETIFYNLDAIIAVGYKVNSHHAALFRRWATAVLKAYMVKGFVLDDARLKQGSNYFGKDYFEELLERIREIRASERRFYQKITDIYAQCSIDYDPSAPGTRRFYAAVQNKLHYAVTGQTASEIVATRANAKQPNMGLTSWPHAPKGKILKKDVSIAKNYLTAAELQELNHVVTMYLDYAELQAKRQVPMKMADWIKKLGEFLQFNEYQLLQHVGKVKALVAKEMAETEYLSFRVIQDQQYLSDFDTMVQHVKKAGAQSEPDKGLNNNLTTLFDEDHETT